MNLDVENQSLNNTNSMKELPTSTITHPKWFPYLFIWPIQLRLADYYIFNYKEFRIISFDLHLHILYLILIYLLVLESKSDSSAVKAKNTSLVFFINAIFVIKCYDSVSFIVDKNEYIYIFTTSLVFLLVNSFSIYKINDYTSKYVISTSRTFILFGSYLILNSVVLIIWFGMRTEFLLLLVILIECCLDIQLFKEVKPKYKVSKIILELPTIFILLFRYSQAKPLQNIGSWTF